MNGCLKIINPYVLLLFISLITGCSTVVSKADNGLIGVPYSGITYNIKMFPCHFIMGIFVPPYIFVMPFVHIADLGLSFVADTLFLPIDLLSDPPQHRKNISCHL